MSASAKNPRSRALLRQETTLPQEPLDDRENLALARDPRRDALSRPGDVSPNVYYKWRAEAHEAVIIVVESVSIKPMKDGTREVEVAARVVAVQRSKSGLQKGGNVVIRYENQDEVKDAPIGSSWAPVLKKGEFYPAFLIKAKAKDHFEPAARSMSFEL